MPVSFSFVGPGYMSQARVADGERSVNVYVERGGPGASIRGGQYLVSTAGLKRFATLPTAPVRALFAGDNRNFAIGGSKLYEFFANGTVGPAIGDCGNTPHYSQAQIFSNGPQLMVVSNLQAYITDGSKPMGAQLVAAKFSDTGLPVQATTGCYLGTYFIVQTPDSQQFQISDIAPDGASWLSLDFGQKTEGSDRLCAIFADHAELWLIGFRTTEVWYNSGAGNFPFSKIQGAFIEQGCSAPFSVVKLDNSMFWLGGDERGAGVVWRMQGYTPIRVSNHAVEFAIQRYGSITDAIGVSRQYLGHSFYELHFPSADACWVYDVATGYWHERLRWAADQNKWHEHPCRTHAYGNFPGALPGASSGQHFVGDSRNGNIYLESADFFDNAGEVKRWLRSSPDIVENLKYFHTDELLFDMQMGGGDLPCPFLEAGNDPQVMLRVSDDGAFSWSPNERWASAGKLAQHEGRYRVVYRQLGRSADRAYELSGSDPIQIAIVDAKVS